MQGQPLEKVPTRGRPGGGHAHEQAVHRPFFPRTSIRGEVGDLRGPHRRFGLNLLPRTGDESGLLVDASLGLLAGGLILMYIGRRRRVIRSRD